MSFITSLLGTLIGCFDALTADPIKLLKKFIFRDSYWTPAINIDTSIAKIESLVINGAIHSVLLRGNNKRSPVILILHGGPGGSDLFVHSIYGRLLEENFVVVHYDQRGSCKSGYANRSLFTTTNNTNAFNNTLTIDQHVLDTIEISKWLHKNTELSIAEYGLYLIGGSWGSMLAQLVVQKCPDLYKKVLLRGLVVNIAKSERIGMEFIKRRMEDFGPVYFSKKIMDDVQSLDPTYSSDSVSLIRQREWLTLLGGIDYKYTACKIPPPLFTYIRDTTKAGLLTPEFSLMEILSIKSNIINCLTRMWSEMVAMDMTDAIHELTIPVAVAHGRHDYCTAHSLVMPYLEQLKAPHKVIMWFEKSGHSPQRDEPKEFVSFVKHFFLNVPLESYTVQYPVLVVQ